MSTQSQLSPLIDVDGQVLYEEPNLTGSPERNLLMAILERALLDLVGNEDKQVEDAEQWFFGEEEQPLREQEFSFPWICQQLDLDLSTISEKVRTMPKRGNSRIAPWYTMRSEPQAA